MSQRRDGRPRHGLRSNRGIAPAMTTPAAADGGASFPARSQFSSVAHDDDRACGVVRGLMADRAQQQLLETAAATRTDHEEIGVA